MEFGQKTFKSKMTPYDLILGLLLGFEVKKGQPQNISICLADPCQVRDEEHRSICQLYYVMLCYVRLCSVLLG